MGYFREMGSMTIGNLVKAAVKVRHTHFPLIFSYLLKIIGSMMFTFSGISRLMKILSTSIKPINLCQLEHFRKC